MAGAAVEDFLTCAVCLDSFTEPVSLSCHHSFCRSCLQRHWDQTQTKTCPVCRRKSSRDEVDVNFALRELCLAVKGDKEAPAQTKAWPVCGTHPEVPPLFCKDEARALCPVCEFSLHTHHTVVSGEDAERELKEQRLSQLQSLTQQREELRATEKLYEEMAQHSEKQVEQCERQIRAVFSELQQFLKEEEKRALAALRKEQLRQAQAMGPELQRIREQLSSLSQSISEQRLHPETHSPHSSQPRAGLLINQAKVLGNLGFRVWKRMRSVVSYSPVILDPNSAHKYLYSSEDLSAVRHGETKYQRLPDNPERFIKYHMVLGAQGFSSGTHQWDVRVGDHPRWTIGVAKESVDRIKEVAVSPKSGMWCLRYKDGRYTNGRNKVIPVEKAPEKIRVQLDYDRGQVSFYEAGSMTHLWTHSDTFTEKLLPLISVGKAGDAETKELQISQAQGEDDGSSDSFLSV